MKTIPLTKGQVALVDDGDYKELSKFNWYALESKNAFYASRTISHVGRNGRTAMLMHRQILGLKDPKIHCDHRDGNGCNNQRVNIRTSTRAQNGTSFRTPRNDKTSKFRGVGWHKRCSKWFTRIRVSGKLLYLGIFTDEIEAAKAYDEAALKYFGEFATPNFPNQTLTKGIV